MTDDGMPLQVDWPTCGISGLQPCLGIRVEGEEACLTHVDPQVRKTFLAALSPASDLDLRGIRMESGLLHQLLAALRSEQGLPMLGHVRFDRAQFNEPADFEGARFLESASFEGARFSEKVAFDNARFHRGVVFDRSRFEKEVWFYGTAFEGKASFVGAQFDGDAIFLEASFGEPDWKEEWWTPADFDETHFELEAGFFAATFHHGAQFKRAQFRKLPDFGRASFGKNAEFNSAQFKDGGTLGPLLAETLDLSHAIFEQPMQIEAAASVILCANARFGDSVTMRLRYAEIVLNATTFVGPSTVSFAPNRFWTPEHSIVPGGILEENLIDLHGNDPVPRLMSVRSVDAHNLVLTDLNLAACLFAGAHHLDQLRFEGPRTFADTPHGWRLGRVGGQGLPIWRWTQRQALAEEHRWRAGLALPASPSGRPHPKRVGWNPLTCQVRSWRVEQPGQVRNLGPEYLASIYRALRKSQEDSKNEPGAADFYYGEMEMRRLDAHTPWAERMVLGLYWLFSGYGLRGLRALAWLAVVVVGTASLLQAVGFNGGDPSFRDALIYAAQSTISITSNNKALTEHVSWAGEIFRILLRLAGPVLLGLALLSVRNRVKR